MNKIIPLGSEVRCVLSGVTGLVASMSEQLNGNVKYAVQPKSADGVAYPEAYDIDQQSLDVLGKGISERATTPITTDIRIGEKVKDKVTGFVGIAVSKHTYLNGCVHFLVVPPKTEGALINDQAPGGSYLSVERLEVKGKGLAPEIESKPLARTGGPATRAVRL